MLMQVVRADEREWKVESDDRIVRIRTIDFVANHQEMFEMSVCLNMKQTMCVNEAWVRGVIWIN